VAEGFILSVNVQPLAYSTYLQSPVYLQASEEVGIERRNCSQAISTVFIISCLLILLLIQP